MEPLPQRSWLVTGSRSITSREWVYTQLNTCMAKYGRPTQLVHGGARGVDQLAGSWAVTHRIPVKVVRPDFRTWPISTYRWKAYTQRDYDMVDMADEVVALWDGHSSGTRLTLVYAESKGKLRETIILYA